MFILASWASPTGRIIIYAGMIAGPVSLVLGWNLSDNNFGEIFAGILFFIFFLGGVSSIGTVIAFIDHGYPPSENAEREKLEKEFRMDIFTKAKEIAKNSRSAEVQPPPFVSSKLLIFSEHYDHLGLNIPFYVPAPFEEAQLKDKEFTVIFVRYRVLDRVGTYKILLEQRANNAYKVEYDIYCIDWSTKKVTGRHKIYSSPPKERPDSDRDQFGNPADVYNWLETVSERKK